MAASVRGGGPLTALLFAPAGNSHGKKDATGAFHPEAVNFARYLEGRGVTSRDLRFDQSQDLWKRRRVVDAVLVDSAGQAVEAVAWFCHGWRDGLQSGHVLGTIPTLAKRLAGCLGPGAPVILYACDTARDSDGVRDDDRKTGPGGAGGFASELFMALHDLGRSDVRVYAHATEGHTTRNPWLRVWRTDADLHSGDWVIDPDSDLWRAWAKALQGPGPLRFAFPWLSPADLAARLTRPE